MRRTRVVRTISSRRLLRSRSWKERLRCRVRDTLFEKRVCETSFSSVDSSSRTLWDTIATSKRWGSSDAAATEYAASFTRLKHFVLGNRLTTFVYVPHHLLAKEHWLGKRASSCFIPKPFWFFCRRDKFWHTVFSVKKIHELLLSSSLFSPHFL